MNIFEILTPTKFNLFSEVFKNIRDRKEQFEDRFGLDHYIDSSLDTTLPEADGYHKRTILKEYITYVDSINGTIPDTYEPPAIAGTGILYVKLVSGVPRIHFKNSTKVTVIKA